MFSPLKFELDNWKPHTNIGVVTKDVKEFLEDAAVWAFGGENKAQILGLISTNEMLDVSIDLENLAVRLQIVPPPSIPVGHAGPSMFSSSILLENMSDSEVYNTKKLFEIPKQNFIAHQYDLGISTARDLYEKLPPESKIQCQIQDLMMTVTRVDRRGKTLYVTVFNDIANSLPPIIYVTTSKKKTARIKMYTDLMNSVLRTMVNQDTAN